MVSKELAQLVADLEYRDLSSEVIEMTKRCIEDILGVAIAGSEKPASLIWTKLINSGKGEGEASLWKKGFPKVNRWGAACVNAAYGHVLDMDDLHNASIVHLAVVTVPAALAVGQYLNKSGQDLITAVVAGYEAGARIGEAINPASYWFWHTTGVVGNFSAAVTAGKLYGLDAVKMNHCLGTAGSQAAGLWEFMKDGAMSKTLHTGKACLNGIISAELAKEGFTGATSILEGDKGFIRAVAPEYDLVAVTRNFAKPYKILENSFKPYACCRHTHSAIYGIQQLVKEYGIKHENVSSINDKTYSTAVNLTDNPTPQTLYGHKFSLQYCIAGSLVYGNALDDIFSEEKTNNPLVKAMMKKVKIILDPKIDTEYKENPEKWIHELEIITSDRKIYKKRVEYPLGDEHNPFDIRRTDEKFRMLTEQHLSDEEKEQVLMKLHNLEDIKNINQLFV